VSCHLRRGGGDDDREASLLRKDGEGEGGGDEGEGGPRLSFAGTVYPSAHEPNRCVGADSRGAEVVVLDSTGRTFSATVNAAGNYFLLASQGSPRPPLRAKVVFEGRERVMVGAVPTGDCNACHTQNGGSVVAGRAPAPGRILLP
jgi:hypothetical protein